jgi:hypothetical protein
MEFRSKLLSELSESSELRFLTSINVDFLFYLNVSDQASRTNFVGRPIVIYTILNCPIIPVGKELTVFEFRSEMQPTLLFDVINVDFGLFEFFKSSFKD